MIGVMSIGQLHRQLSRFFTTVMTADSGPFSKVCTDSRAIKAGDFFVALRGPNFNAHEYLHQVQEMGAVGAMVDTIDPTCSLAQLQVDDTVLGLGELARANRSRFNSPVVAITGSSGKTTVRTMVDGILREHGEVLTTQGNLNNHIGVPLTLLRLTGQERYAVIEMGASAIGEIAYLCELAVPDVALVNNVMPAHLEGFGSLEGVADAKGEIYQGVKADGCCVVNLDDQFSGQWLAQLKDRTLLSFSLKNTAAHCYASNIEVTDTGLQFEIQLLGRTLPICLSVGGYHNVRNALAATCCAYAVGASDEAIVCGLSKFSSVNGRMKFCRGPNGSTIIDDSYNANPGSVRAAIDVLADIKGANILVMGEMGELGEESHLHHAEIGAYASGKALQAVFTIGPMARAVSENFSGPSKHFENQKDLLEHLLSVVTDSDCTVLIKGSRSARMDLVAGALIDEDEL
ncbi:UDP-N-acetylmuramoyl-tripeptide--D-alanyl-D-alanine ligase [Gilvimarinus sp. SDUM040013]|uniref:UDP-N-acetylmuramoyl-tripeptide--D-alanyl-D-alanine ligase n=1 Tax=Gilvimarinus gilvus TaxID=3058038 RepID=A0ABU4RST3_9GAMM|nr:UDP-N-acetylmuramoyl-tripeptide--D-alanyl-D-alanine ligase [Gilvimarinus sp. SDUM040013]MDO3388395.1 UDP-N-acetylmuramoyl-tripeptide--D-alanyl-D-alanine ligase [Gilvimarinus sp. SDUM040013]MDX6847945.1 UDP-N-acetylmuramoyl-tripeptide--D-alanyl-D-alanine ligase [Gilvimarinus sp. SDUM040013]